MGKWAKRWKGREIEREKRRQRGLARMSCLLDRVSMRWVIEMAHVGASSSSSSTGLFSVFTAVDPDSPSIAAIAVDDDGRGVE